VSKLTVIHWAVVTVAAFSGGWMNWIRMKVSPAPIAAKPETLVSLVVVTVMVSSSLLRSRGGATSAFNVRTDVVIRHRLMM
jgi:hypothetical protein